MPDNDDQPNLDNPRVVIVDGIPVDVTGDLTDEEVSEYVRIANGEQEPRA